MDSDVVLKYIMSVFSLVLSCYVVMLSCCVDGLSLPFLRGDYVRDGLHF